MNHTDAPVSTARRIAFGLLSIVVSALILVLIVRAVDPSEIAARLRVVEPIFLVLLIATATFSNLVLMPTKLRLILWMDGLRMGYFESLLLRLGGMPLKFLLPLKSGEAAKVLYLKRVRRYDLSRGIGFLLFDKVTSLTGLSALLVIGCLATPGLRAYALPAAGAFAFLAALMTTPLAGLLVRGIPFLPARLREGLDGMVHIFHRVPLRSRLYVLAYGAGLMGFDMVYYVLALRAVGVDISFSLILTRVPLVYLATALPIAFFGIGLREGSVMLLLRGTASAEQLFLAGALVTLFEIVLYSVVGVLFVPTFLARLRDGPADRADA